MSCFKKAFNKQTRSPTPGQTSEDSKCKAPAPSPDTLITSPDTLIRWIDEDLSDISREAKDLQVYYTGLNDRLSGDLEKLHRVYKEIKSQGRGEIGKQLKEFKRELLKLKIMTPSKYRIGAGKDYRYNDERLFKHVEKITQLWASKKMPQLLGSVVFETSMEFKDFEAHYKELDNRSKLCLLCFSIFPQGAVIKKRLMLQWWFVEGFASTEEDAGDIFKKLMDRGFIEPVNDNRILSVGSCRLHPFHRSALVVLAERARFFNFESGGEASPNFSGSFQACLNWTDDESKKDHGPIQELEKLHLLMNVNHQTLEFVEEWFPKMKNLNFLYLGRWKESANYHIIVDRDSKFLNKLGKMKYVKFLSLKGVTNITQLPDSILQLKNLKVLDLRACHNLMEIPGRIDYLEKLTHLDMSGSFLTHMPKGLSDLSNLKVLKGFFVGQPADIISCKLRDLKKLGKLEKLCIVTDRVHFPDEKHVADLENLLTLTKLTIKWVTWEASIESIKYERAAKLPPKLIKLDLKWFPKSYAPDWLKLKNLKGIELKKLYINGGNLCDLGQYQDDEYDEKKWTVEVLRLKNLGKMEMDWRQLQGLFPELKYLENVSCPKLALFPCDAKGVWIKSQ